MESLTAPQGYARQASRTIGTPHRSEQWWRDNYYDLRRIGYDLHPRYHPDWKPSWIQSGKDFFSVEDGQPSILRAAMDAIRRCDGKRVMLKKIFPEEEPHELRIAHLFSSREVARDPRNHCVPLLDVIELRNTGQKLMVMPFLRPFNDPPFQTFDEIVTFFTQVCEGLQLMHERNIAHRDCTASNIMFDPSGMYPRGSPEQMNRSQYLGDRTLRYTRTQRPPRYFMIGSTLSRHYDTREVLDEPLCGNDKSAPEHNRDGTLCNPFHTDIYYLGNLVRQEFIGKYDGFEFMQDLVGGMTDTDPRNRPLIRDVVTRFSHIRESLSESKLRSPIVSKNKPYMFLAVLCAKQALLTLWCIFSCKAAFPKG